MSKYSLINNSICIVFLAVVFISCKHKEDEYHSIIDKIETESKNYHGISISSEEYISDLDTIKITENGHTFLIPKRKGELKSYVCTECHTKPFKEMQSKDLKKAHWDIKLDHASENTMNCTTCHDGNDMNNLRSLTDTSIDFNKSYQLCSQCHTSQFKDWSGGAHGKKIGGWAPPRMSMTCVNCHDAHKPHFESKWPEVYNTQKAEERK